MLLNNFSTQKRRFLNIFTTTLRQTHLVAECKLQGIQTLTRNQGLNEIIRIEMPPKGPRGLVRRALDLDGNTCRCQRQWTKMDDGLGGMDGGLQETGSGPDDRREKTVYDSEKVRAHG